VIDNRRARPPDVTPGVPSQRSWAVTAGRRAPSPARPVRGRPSRPDPGAPLRQNPTNHTDITGQSQVDNVTFVTG